METILQNLRYTFRSYARSPLFTIVVIVSLALAIGANTAIFSFIDAALLQSLPVKDPNTLVALFTLRSTGDKNYSFSYPDYADLRNQNDAFSGLIAYSSAKVNMSGTQEPELLDGELVSPNYFSVLGLSPAAGSFFALNDNSAPGADPVVIISYRLWRQRFASNPQINGQVIRVNTYSFTIVGVAPEGFTGLVQGAWSDIWIPLSMEGQVIPDSKGDVLQSRNMNWLNLVGRMKPGISLELAQGSLGLLFDRLAKQFPRRIQEQLVLTSNSRGETQLLGNISSSLLFLMGASAIVLLIACANVGNLFLARSLNRRKEIAIRLAIGASRAQIVKQLITESLILSIVGGIVGLALAYLFKQYLAPFLLVSDFGSLKLAITINGRVLGFTLALSILTGLLFGLVPALQTSNPNLVSALNNEADLILQGDRKISLRSLLVIAQLSLSFILLIGAGLFIRSLQKIESIDIGYNSNNVLVMSLDLGLQRYERLKGREFYMQLFDRLEAIPGVQSVSLARIVPPSSRGMAIDLFVPGQETLSEQERHVDYNVVGPNFFAAMQIPLLEGRDFRRIDSGVTARVAVINRTLAKRLWPNEPALGKSVSLTGPNGPFLEVVGVAKDGKYRNLKEDPKPFLYIPLAISYRPDINLLLRTGFKSEQIVAKVRQEIQSLDANLPVFDIRLLSDQVKRASLKERMVTVLVSSYSMLAILIATVGLYAVLAYFVSMRTREIGIRLALGASPGDILKIVVGNSMALVAIGLSIGLVAALLLSRLIASQLYGISATDPVTLILTAIALGVVGLAASITPAIKATKIEPVEALKRQ